ncbi:MAG: AAA family ATPase [Gammaproteobacteria bacterium]|nr:AAA family ATPase [Gammaproteobacteria bacterium]NIR82846.1 AAA family ATPase [Gammaproteobacteria bacterium]NIR89955.1 AAA family ATPase [Gammaproteobacteria bacterium]NIU04004.1 AAA family ATPase [Gammaproteobacteria bacterium]NIV51324.1 AAA family ATPase [Gammaproteobacteria bacterium]
MADLRLNLLGGFELTAGVRRPLPVPSKKACALLAYLALAGGEPQPRAKLAALLWEESPDGQARGSLRQALTALRRALPEREHASLASEGDTVTLDTAALAVDVLEFERACARADASGAERAVELYRGDLLEAFHARAPAFEDWLLVERSRLREQALAAMERVIDHHLATGDMPRLIAAAVRLIGLDPLRESAHRVLMRAYARRGQTASALRQYRTCRALLRRELGVAPEPATDALYREVVQARRTPQRIAPADPRAVHPADAASQAEPDPSTSVASTARELRQATILAVGVARPEPRTFESDPEETGELLNRFYDLVDGVVGGYGGTILAQFADTAVAAFGVARAHGNESERAVRASLELDEAARRLTPHGQSALHIRTGLAAGQVLVADDGRPRSGAPPVSGDCIHLACALQALAAPGELLATEGVRRALGERVDAEECDSAREAPVRAWRIRGLHSELPVRRHLVGRRAERHQFASVLDACVGVHTGCTLLVRGEAGIGKSRLLEAFASLARARGFETHLARVLDFGVGAGQDAVHALVSEMLGVGDCADPDARRAAAERALAEGLVHSEQQVFLNDLLNLPQSTALAAEYDAMDSAARANGKRTLVAALARAQSAHRPCMIAVEDVHWADRDTLSYLAAIAAATRQAPVLLVMTSRTQGDPISTAWRNAARGALITTIDLGPLSEDDARELARGIHVQAPELVEICIQRAGGNPLFLEQLLAGGEGGDEVPGSIRSLVLARLDRLHPADKHAVKAAAIMGQRFTLPALRHLIEDSSYDCAALNEDGLVNADGDAYLFSHALVQEAVYTSLPRSARHELHARTAAWFETRDARLRAEHLERANDPGAAAAYLEAARNEAHVYRFEQALTLVERGLALEPPIASRFELTWLQGELLRDVGRVEDAIDAFRRAIAVSREPSQQCRAWIGLASGMRLIDRHGDALEALAQAHAAIGHDGPVELLAQICGHRGNAYFPLADIDRCLAEHERARDYARRAGSPRIEALASGGLGDAYYQRGRMRTAHAHFDRCIALAREHGFGRIECANLCMRGVTRMYLNDLPGALEDCRIAAQTAERVGDQRAEMVARDTLAGLSPYALRWDEALDACERSLIIARRLGSRQFEADILGLLGYAVAQTGERREGANLLRDAWSLARATRPAFDGPWILSLLARVTDDAGERTRALTEGEALLASGAVSHNHLHFHQNAMELGLETGCWEMVERYAAALEAYTETEPLPWSDFFIARARALVEVGRGARGDQVMARLRRLRDEAHRAGLAAALPAIETALSTL